MRQSKTAHQHWLKRSTSPQEPQLLADAISSSLPSQEYIRSLKGKRLEPKTYTYGYRYSHGRCLDVYHHSVSLRTFEAQNLQQAKDYVATRIPPYTQVWIYKQQNGSFKRLKNPYHHFAESR